MVFGSRDTSSTISGTTQTQWWVHEIGEISSVQNAVTSTAASVWPLRWNRMSSHSAGIASRKPMPIAAFDAHGARSVARFISAFSDWLPAQCTGPIRPVSGSVTVQYLAASCALIRNIRPWSTTNVASPRSASLRRPVMNRCPRNTSGVSLIAAATPTSTPPQRLPRAPMTSMSSRIMAIRIRLIWPRKIVRHTGSRPRKTRKNTMVERAGEAHQRGPSSAGRGSAPIAIRIDRAIAAERDGGDQAPGDLRRERRERDEDAARPSAGR